MDFFERCPACGTTGKPWPQERGILQCPKCASLFSHYGVVTQPEQQQQDFWS